MGVAAQAANLEFTDFVGFGDSLSDKGRQPAILATQPPQDGGRFSDGPTWMERLGAQFAGENINLALGGATAGPNTASRIAGYEAAEGLVVRDPADPDDIPFVDLRDFGTQVDTFLSASRGLAASVGDNPLVTVLIGGNDFLQIDDFSDTAAAFQVGTTVVTSISEGISKLALSDAKFDDFFVMNLPSFARSPSLFGAPDAFTDPIDGAIEAFNANLEASLAVLAASLNVNIEVFDLYTEFNALYDEGLAAGLIGDAACLPGGGVNNCPNPGDSADYLFLDDVHPNAFLHKGIADATLAQLAGPAPVPLPAGLPLLMFAVGVFALAKRRASCADPLAAV